MRICILYSCLVCLRTAHASGSRSLRLKLMSLRPNWVNAEEYNLLVEEARKVVEETHKLGSTDSASLDNFIDQVHQIFGGNAGSTLIENHAEALVENACLALPEQSDQNQLTTDHHPDLTPIERLIENQIVKLTSVEGFPSGESFCISPGKYSPRFKCPEGTSAQILKKNYSTSKAFEDMYDHFVHIDCVFLSNYNQIYEDAMRLTIAHPLARLIESENYSSKSNEPDIGNVAHAFVQVVGEQHASNMDHVHRRQWELELGGIFETCLETIFVYSVIGRSWEPFDRFNNFRNGREVQDAWRKFNHPTESDHLQFEYYQGMMNACGYLMLFGRRPSISDADRMGGAHSKYPSKNDVYNMIAAIVEDVDDIPLGPPEIWLKYYDLLIGLLIPQIDSVYEFQALPGYAEQKPSEDGLDLGRTPLGVYFSNFVTLSGMDNNTDNNVQHLQAVWNLVFEHGHYGLIAFYLSSYRSLRLTGQYSCLQDILLKLQYPIQILMEIGSLSTALDNAQAMLQETNWVHGNTFKQVLDQFELTAIKMARDDYDTNTAA